MKSIAQISVAVFVMLTLAVVYAAAQQPAVSATQTVSGYVLGPDDQIVIRVIDAPDISEKPVLIGTNGDVGIWHETYRVRPGDYESVYVNMPSFGVGKAGELVEASGKRDSAAGRLAAAQPAT